MKTWTVYKITAKPTGQKQEHYFQAKEFHLIRTVLNEQAEIGEELLIKKLKLDEDGMKLHFGPPPYL